MAVINLRNYYPCYRQDCMLEVSEELAAQLKPGSGRNVPFYAGESGIVQDTLLTEMTVWSKLLWKRHILPKKCTNKSRPLNKSMLRFQSCPKNRQSGSMRIASWAYASQK